MDFIVVNSNSPNQVFKTLDIDLSDFTVDLDVPTAIGLDSQTGGRDDDTRAITVCDPSSTFALCLFVKLCSLGCAEVAAGPGRCSRIAISFASRLQLPTHPPHSHTRPIPSQVGNFDGDDYPDIIVANGPGYENKVYINPGSGDFSSVTPVGIGSDSENDDSRAVVVDMFGSQRTVVFANAGQANKKYDVPNSLSDFAGESSSTIGADDADDTRSIAVSLINDDSFKDIVATNVGVGNKQYTNPGSADFSIITAQDVKIVGKGGSAAASYALVLADLNSDGYPDIISNNEFYLNPGVTSPVSSSTMVPSLLIDLNGDTLDDLVTGGVVYLQTDDKDFSTAVPLPIGIEPLTFTSITAIDIDGDNFPDLITAFKSSATTPLKQSGVMIFLNPGSGDFSTVAPISVGGADQGTESVTAVDVNGDGYVDIVAGNGFFNGKFVRNKIYLNRGDMTFGLPDEAIEFGATVGAEGDKTLSVTVRFCDNPPPPHSAACLQPTKQATALHGCVAQRHTSSRGTRKRHLV